MNLLEALEYHDTLNPLIWTEDNTLRKEVEIAVKKIVDLFIGQQEIKIPVLDIYILGSNASYNYSPTSDLDVHIITNYDNMDCNEEILQTLFNALKTNFNKDYDFTIHGVNVELYVQDVNSSTISNGIYSVFDREWIKFPERAEDPKTEVEDKELLQQYQDEVIKTLTADSSEEVGNMIDKLYLLRQKSLTKDGEFGDGNLVFKEIRSLGLLDKLKDYKKELVSKELTVEQLKESK